jgi:hypothetical protein
MWVSDYTPKRLRSYWIKKWPEKALLLTALSSLRLPRKRKSMDCMDPVVVIVVTIEIISRFL